jgi:hypothetical protein
MIIEHDFNEILQLLNEEFDSGTNLFKSILNQFDIKQKDIFFKDEHFSQTNWIEAAKWYKRVEKILEENYPKSEHLSSFRKPSSVNIVPPHAHKHTTKLLISFESYLEELKKIIRNIKQDQIYIIQQRSTDISQNEDILYQITYKEHDRKIKINNILIAKPDFDSENELFFTYVYKNPNKKIFLEELEKSTKHTYKKRLLQIITDLKFTGTLKDTFFPGISKNSVKFINPITIQYAQNIKLPEITFR